MSRTKPADAQKARRHVPLSEDYLPSYSQKQKTSKRKKSQIEDDDDGFVDPKSSRKILKIGQELADEDETETHATSAKTNDTAFSFASRDVLQPSKVDKDDEDDAEYDDDWENDDDDEQEIDGDEIDPKDLDIFNKFNPQMDPSTLLRPASTNADANGGGDGTDLAALILEKIDDFEASHDPERQNERRMFDGESPEQGIELPEKVIAVYQQVGLILSRYKSGNLPKPFKILAGVPQWEVLLDITEPANWTPNASYEATRLFTSSRPAVAQAFFHDILLPQVRQDISATKKLNVHLYKALKKALYKPASFFKGVLFPLVEGGTCTLREAQIISSVLARVSIPVLHSAAAIHRLCEVAAEQMTESVESGGATNIFIRTLLEKKYALPYRVVDALVFHFLRFRGVGAQGNERDAGLEFRDDKLPVLWHQCLLAFAQRYKNDITEDQREALLDLLLTKAHRAIGPEVRRELLEGRGRGVVVENSVDLGGDDTMLDT